MLSSTIFIVLLSLALAQAQVDPLPSDCGQRVSSHHRIRRVARTKRLIIDGDFAEVGEYPWQVFISFLTETNKVAACGATIIHPEWLLTAAHCVPNVLGFPVDEGILACVGSIDILSCGKIVNSTKIIPHYGYEFPFDPEDKSAQPNDIALVKLADALEFDANTRPVCLPNGASDGPQIGADIEIAGWGLTSSDGPGSQFLKKAQMNVVHPATCVNDPSYHIICLQTGPTTDNPPGRSCEGDSGGYAGIETNGRSVQYGVTSFGAFACLEPDGYTDVAFYSDWIREQIRNS